MKNKIFMLLAFFLAISCTIFFWPSDDKKIRGNLSSLAEYCSSANQEPVVETLQKAALAAKLCTASCTIQIQSFKIDREFSHKEITDHLLMMKKRLPNTDFNFHDTVVDIKSDDSAEVITTLRLHGKTIDERFSDAYEMIITLEKEDGDWRFSSFSVVEFMKK